MEWTRNKNCEEIPEDCKRDSKFLKKAKKMLDEILSGKFYYERQKEQKRLERMQAAGMIDGPMMQSEPQPVISQVSKRNQKLLNNLKSAKP